MFLDFELKDKAYLQCFKIDMMKVTLNHLSYQMTKLTKNFTQRDFGQNLDILGIKEGLRDKLEDYLTDHEKQCECVGKFIKKMDAFLFTAIELSKEWVHMKDPAEKQAANLEQLVYFQMFCEQDYTKSIKRWIELYPHGKGHLAFADKHFTENGSSLEKECPTLWKIL